MNIMKKLLMAPFVTPVTPITKDLHKFDNLCEQARENIAKELDDFMQESLVKAGLIDKPMNYDEAVEFSEKHRCEIVSSLSKPNLNRLMVDGEEICTWSDSRNGFTSIDWGLGE